jgi:hypothetical protein
MSDILAALAQSKAKVKTVFSPCRAYRYSLWREWSGGNGYAMFVGLNPSTADEDQDDPTIRRCIAFAKSWGYSGLCMTNLFAFRATDPKDMKKADEPIGIDNNKHLITLANNAGIIIAAWGANGSYKARNEEVRSLLPVLHCLKLTKDGHPGHPLYLPRTLTPIEFK